MYKIRIKAMLFAMGLVLLLIAYFVYAILQDKKRVLDEKTRAHRQLLSNAFELSILDTEKGLSHYANNILTNRALVDAFAAKDRNTLYSLSLPYYSDAVARGDADLTGFIEANGFHFLRMKDPTNFGDNLTKKRPILADAIKTRQPIVSLDATKYNVSLVSIFPIFKGENFLGIVQVAAKIERIQERLNANSSIKSALAFDTKTLQALLPDQNFTEYGMYSLISSNDPLFERLPKNYSFQDSMRYSVGEKTYIIASRGLKTYNNKPLARMICALDITDDELAYEREIRHLLLISVFVLLILAFILYFGFESLIAHIRKVSAKLNQQMHDQLHTDSLTGLPNRRTLLKNIERKRYLALILLNIDNFKEINDFYGHEIGDKILQEVAKSIEEEIQQYPLTLYKMHSDEYALALDQFMNLDAFDLMCHTILNALDTKNYDIDDINVSISLSMGADICADKACDLIGRADMALKTAKKRSLPFVKYHHNLQIKEEYENNIFWSKKLKETIATNRFKLFYHSIHNSQTHAIVEYEALIRVVDEDGTIYSPYAFLEIAKKSRLYNHITRFVVEEIFEQLQNTPHMYSINLSVEDILNREIQGLIYERLAETGVGDRLIFELLESEGIENYEEISAFISYVKEYNCRIAIDDFGTGYSNFAHIMKLNVDFIKIDGSLIKRLDHDVGAQNIVRTITEFARRLNIQTIAEFVATKEIHDQCVEVGIDHLQGYYLSEPSSTVA